MAWRVAGTYRGNHALSAILFGVIAVHAVTAPMPLFAQPAPVAPAEHAARPLSAETFVRLAHSTAVVQASAAELAASREARPDAKAFAQRMVEFRRGQIAKLEGLARDNQIAIPAKPEWQHRVILENLEPLDFLALSRRYAEFQVQALEQEMQIYGGAADGAEVWIRAFAAGIAPGLQTFLEEAREMKKAVGP